MRTVAPEGSVVLPKPALQFAAKADFGSFGAPTGENDTGYCVWPAPKMTSGSMSAMYGRIKNVFGPIAVRNCASKSV